MAIYDWNDIEREQMSPGIARQVIHTGNMTVARIFIDKDGLVPDHHHENEQVTILEEGRLLFTIDGEDQVLVAGQVMRIPPNAVHRVLALENSRATDLFSPRREDWIRGDDAYLRG